MADMPSGNMLVRALHNRVLAVAEAVRQQRSDPWHFAPFSAMGLGYRATVISATCVAGALSVFGWLALDARQPVDVVTLVVALMMCAIAASVVLRDNSIQISGVHVALGLPLVYSHHYIEAIVLVAVFPVLQAGLKPIVAHLTVINVASNVAMLVTIALVFEALAGTAQIGVDGRWYLAALGAYCAGEIVAYCTSTTVAIVGRILPPRLATVDALYHAWRSILTVWSIAVLIAVPLTADFPGAIIALALPLVLRAHEWRTRDQLVDAKIEADSDPLTGLANRRSFDKHLASLLAEAPDAARRHWLIYADLDNFKQLNDSRGHDAGDMALQAAAYVISRSVREDDVCARIGGEEFVVLVRNADRDEIGAIAERIRMSIESNLNEFTTTISVGVHAFGGGDQPDEVIAAADEAMYRSKQAGRNRITFSSDAIDVAAA